MFLHTLSCPQTTGWKYSKSSTIIPAYTKKSLKRLHFKDLYSFTKLFLRCVRDFNLYNREIS